MEHIFKVEGMTCGHCERAVEQALQTVDAQAQVSIDRAIQQVKVVSQSEPAALVAAIQEEGYSVIGG
ncbi:MAG: heavy-metal-associated domain-containing protein [Comamonas sp.]|nr:heavy-metal-associated domain-containing protein [Comamonas sp.]